MGLRGETGLSRRQLVAGTIGAGLGAGVSKAVAAQATPAPSATGVDAERVLRVSQALVGVGSLAEAALPALVALLGAEPGIDATLDELATIADMTPGALRGMSPEAQAVARNILSYWYLGEYDGSPVANRADVFFQLACWQSLPYMTQPTLCKAFGYWALDVEIE